MNPVQKRTWLMPTVINLPQKEYNKDRLDFGGKGKIESTQHPKIT
jgi:hypothetical protein